MAQGLYELPVGWEWKSFPKLALTKGFSVGKVPKSKYGESGDTPIIDQSKNEVAGYCETEDYFQGKLPAIVYGDHTNNVKIVDTPFICGADGTKVYVPSEFVTAQYLFRAIERFKPETQGYRRHAPILKKVQIPVPPLAEQKRIVAQLDVLFSRIDQTIAQLQDTQTQTKALWASALDAAFEKKTANTELKAVATFENGDRGKNYPSRKHYVNLGIPFVTAANLERGSIKPGGLNYITRAKFDTLGSGKFRTGDLLFCLRGSLGKFAINTALKEGGIASSLVIVRPSKGMDGHYLKHYFDSPLCLEMINNYDNGSAQPNLSSKSLQKFKIPVPPLPEQEKIVAQLDAIAGCTQALEANTATQLEQLKALKASLLDAAFRGEL